MTPTVQVLPPSAAAEYLGTSEAMLKRWRSCGSGPRFLVWGRRTVRYRLADLDRWLEAQPTAGNVEEAIRLMAG